MRYSILISCLWLATATAQDLRLQSLADVQLKSAGCLRCHAGVEPMHRNTAVKLGCTDCHGGNANAFTQEQAHVMESKKQKGKQRLYTETLEWSYDYLKFINPADLRIAPETCGSCHPSEVLRVKKSMMTHSALLWGGASYNNGILPNKNYILGESYGDGRNIPNFAEQLDFSDRGRTKNIQHLPSKINQVPQYDAKTKQRFGILDFLLPLPRWNITQPPDNFRSFERGGLISRINPSEIGIPNPLDQPGKPDNKLSDRGLGTQLLISSPVLNLHKTRLNDPHLSFFGTNDHAGDYRSSGCSACHVVYANDRAISHSGPYARFGNRGKSFSRDTTVTRLQQRTTNNQQPFPIAHQFTRAVPSSQCMTCHMHQPNGFLNTFYGYQMWDYESGGEIMYDRETTRASGVTSAKPQTFSAIDKNPEESVLRGKWGDNDFLRDASLLNSKIDNAQFADYHGHGWNFRAVFKRDRKGNLLDREGAIIKDPKHAMHGIPTIFGSKFCDAPACRTSPKAVHLLDIHAEKGMHCIDCHTEKDNHGNGNLYGEFHNAIEIQCQDCHGNAYGSATLKTSGVPTGLAGATDLTRLRTPWGRQRFFRRGAEIWQRSMLYDSLAWQISQFSAGGNLKARRAHYLAKDGEFQATAAKPLAHAPERMECSSCHNSWITNCFGCHLPQQANWKKEMNHFEGGESRNWTTYNPQVLRDDALMLAVGPTTKGNKISPARSSSALMLSSRNANREQIYNQQAPISSAGFSSQAFNSHVPHTVRLRETRDCNDCHISKANDNNAWLAHTYLQGSGLTNFMGKYVYVGKGGDGFEAVKVTEDEEPQAVIGSYLHGLAFPEADHELEAHHHSGKVLSLQLRGEYLYAACGEDGLRVFDVANIDNKGFSERIVSAPVSPLGQDTRIDSKFATAVALPTNMLIDVEQNEWIRANYPENQEQELHPLYRYAYITDREEGLILVDVMPLVDRDPRNNFLKRAATFNPENILDGAENLVIAGEYVYICASQLVIANISNPLTPKVVQRMPEIKNPKAIAVQFRYAFVLDDDGLKVIDITVPERARLVRTGVQLEQAYDLYLSRTYAYVASGNDGLVIVDIEKPEAIFIDQKVTIQETQNVRGVNDGRVLGDHFAGAGKVIDDARSVRIAAIYASVFAYVADANNGLLIFQLTSPEMPTYLGFSPRPAPRLIAWHKSSGAIALSRGMDRDRAVDESGNQMSVFGRLGSKPLGLEEQRKLYWRNGKVWSVE